MGMIIVFYLSVAVAIVATLLAITRVSAMHGLLYLVISFLAISLIFYTLGAPFIAALEVIVYAGAIMVLFIFAIMMLNLGPQSEAQERRWLFDQSWAGPLILALILMGELVYILAAGAPGAAPPAATAGSAIDPRQVGVSLFSTYLIGVELASILLLSSLIGAYHLGQARQERKRAGRERAVQLRETAVKAGFPEAAPGELEAQEEH